MAKNVKMVENSNIIWQQQDACREVGPSRTPPIEKKTVEKMKWKKM